MMSVSIYLAGPMFDHTGDFKSPEAQGWREEITLNAPTGVLFVSPAHAFFGANEVTAPALDRIERHMIVACDAVLVNLMEPVPSLGSVRDIEFARQHGKPVGVAGDVRSLMAHDLLVAPTVDAALEKLLLAVADARNVTPTVFGFPLVELRQPEEDEDR